MFFHDLSSSSSFHIRYPVFLFLPRSRFQYNFQLHTESKENVEVVQCKKVDFNSNNEVDNVQIIYVHIFIMLVLCTTIFTMHENTHIVLQTYVCDT